MTKEQIRRYYRYFIALFIGMLIGSMLTLALGNWASKYDPIVMGIFLGVVILAGVAETYVSKRATK